MTYNIKPMSYYSFPSPSGTCPVSKNKFYAIVGSFYNQTLSLSAP